MNIKFVVVGLLVIAGLKRQITMPQVKSLLQGTKIVLMR